MSVLVTGAAGHLGANLIRALLEAGRHVKAMIHRDTKALDGLDVERVSGDVLDPESLRKAFSEVEVVYHLAAVITLESRRDERAERVNVEGVRNVVDACLACGVQRLVHVSSIHAFSPDPVDGVVDEARPLCGEEALPYDRSKAAGERIVRAAVAKGFNAVIVNPTAVVGPHDYRPSAMGQVLLDIYHRRMPALVRGGFNWVDARDVCAGVMAAERLAPAGAEFLLAGHYLRLKELARLVAEVTGAKPMRVTVPISLALLSVPFAAIAARMTGKPARFTRASLHALCHHQRVSHEKATRELGYAPRPLRATIEDTFAWLDSQGLLTPPLARQRAAHGAAHGAAQ